MFWTIANLKEGPVLWGIAMMLGATVAYPGPSGLRRPIMPAFLGFAVVAFLRPHIAFAWLAAIVAAIAIHRRDFTAAVLLPLGIGLAAVVSFFVLRSANPEITDSFSDYGVVETMEDRYEMHNWRGDTAIQRTGAPIPVVSGLALIFLRPFPYECTDLLALFAGAEAWGLTLLILVGWGRLRQRSDTLGIPLVTTSLIVILFLAFFFSYSYNLGGVVRQRLQVFPAVIALAAVPYMVVVPQRNPRLKPTGAAPKAA